MNRYDCADCGLQANTESFEKLSENPAYDEDGVFIIHAICLSLVGDTILDKSGDLLLVRRDYKAIYE